MAILVLRNGLVCGTDTNAVQIDGTYTVDINSLIVNLTVIVPPGVSLVQGTPAQPTVYQFPINALISLSRIGTTEPTLVQTPLGPLNVLMRKLRDLTV